MKKNIDLNRYTLCVSEQQKKLYLKNYESNYRTNKNLTLKFDKKLYKDILTGQATKNEVSSYQAQAIVQQAKLALKSGAKPFGINLKKREEKKILK